MKLAISRFSSIVITSLLLFQGCMYYKLAGPAQEPRVTEIKASSHKYAYTVKHRYTGIVLPDRQQYDRQTLGVVQNALRESLLSNGISDVIMSEKLETDRITIVAYSGYEPDLAEENALLRALSFSWGLVSTVTVCLVPYYEVTHYPAEIHIISPTLEHDKQIRIIQTKYVVAEWWWLPFAFKSNDNTPEDAYYNTHNTQSFDVIGKREKLHYLGWRRVFDRVLAELEKNE